MKFIRAISPVVASTCKVLFFLSTFIFLLICIAIPTLAMITLIRSSNDKAISSLVPFIVPFLIILVTFFATILLLGWIIYLCKPDRKEFFDQVYENSRQLFESFCPGGLFFSQSLFAMLFFGLQMYARSIWSFLFILLQLIIHSSLMVVVSIVLSLSVTQKLKE